MRTFPGEGGGGNVPQRGLMGGNRLRGNFSGGIFLETSKERKREGKVKIKSNQLYNFLIINIWSNELLLEIYGRLP